MANNLKERLTSFSNWKREGLNALYVAIGLIGATLIDRGVQKAVEKWLPDFVPHVGYIKAGVTTLGGLVLSVSQDEKTSDGERLRLIGYGISGAGILSGARMIPAVDSLLSGTDSVNGLKGVENLLSLNLGDFGISDNIKKSTTIEAESVEIDLPELGYTRTNQPVYKTPSQTEEIVSEDLEELTAEFV